MQRRERKQGRGQACYLRVFNQQPASFGSEELQISGLAPVYGFLLVSVA